MRLLLPCAATVAVALAIGGTAAAATPAGDPVKGKATFEAQCSGCHTLEGASYGGPLLAGVYGRKAGTGPDFSYSDGMMKAGFAWDDAKLDAFLADPDKTVPGTAMPINIPDPQDRADLIAFLKTLTGK